MGVSKNNGTPKSTILIGVSIIFTIHFGVPLFLVQHPYMTFKTLRKEVVKLGTPPLAGPGSTGSAGSSTGSAGGGSAVLRTAVGLAVGQRTDAVPSLSEPWGSWEFTLPETNSSPLKMMVSNRNLLFQGSIFRCYVSFREGKASPKPPLNATFWLGK